MEKVIRKSKSIKLKGEDAFIKLMAGQFGVTSDMEIKLIKILIKFDMFTPFAMCKHTREKIRRELGCPYPTTTTAISRLIKSGVIARSGKNYYVNVGFRGLDDIDAIVFKKN